MRVFPTAAALALALAAVPALAQRSGPPDPPGPAAAVTTPDKDSRVVTGTVTELKKGSTMTVRTLDSKTETFWLDEKGQTVNIDPGVAVGSKVKVTEKVNGGKRTLTVEKSS